VLKVALYVWMSHNTCIMTVTIRLRDELAQWLQTEAERRGITPEEMLSEDVETRWTLMAYSTPTEANLIQTISEGLPETFWTRYRTLIARRRAEQLTKSEHEELISLSDQLEEMTLQRTKALAILAKRRKTSIKQLIKEMGITPVSVGV
jgi:hypothetical protein